jgi:hypothetical protein
LCAGKTPDGGSDHDVKSLALFTVWLRRLPVGVRCVRVAGSLDLASHSVRRWGFAQERFAHE